jgi:membrane protease YdiL (CAAX protease family)
VDILIGLGLGTLIVAFSTFLSWLLGWYQFAGFSWQFRPLDILLPAVVMSFIASIQSPLVEEVLFRGFIFQTLSERWSFSSALLFSSFLFGLAHLTSTENTFWWAAILSTFLAGMMFIQAFLVHKSLWIPIGIHFGWIFSGRLLNDIGQSTDKVLFLASNVDGPNLLVAPTGGGAGLFELIGVGIVSLILWRITRK